MSEMHTPLPVPCSGCGDPTPYDTGPDGERPPAGLSFGATVKSPLGLTFIKTHPNRDCVERALRRLDGKITKWPKTKEEKMAETAR